MLLKAMTLLFAGWLLHSPSAHAACEAGDATALAALDREIADFERALASPDTPADGTSTYNLADSLTRRACILADQGRESEATADHCRAARLFIEAVSIPLVSAPARPRALIEQHLCAVGGRLVDGDRAGALALLSSFAKAHAASTGPLREAADEASNQADKLRADFGGVVLHCSPGDTAAIDTAPGTRPCPTRWGVVPVGLRTLTIARADEAPMTERVSVQGDQDVEIPFEQIAAAIRSSREGQRLHAAGDPNSALAAWRRSAEEFAALPGRDDDVADQRIHIAHCLDELGQRDAALATYEATAALPLSPAKHSEVEALRQSLETRMFGAVAVRCDVDDAEVSLGGYSQPSLPCGGRWARVPVGAHTVAAHAPGRRGEAHTIEVMGGRTTTIALSLPRLHALPWTVTGAAAASLATGATFFALASASADDKAAALRDNLDATEPNDKRAAFERGRAANEQMEARAALAYVFTGVGALLGGAALWLWLDRPTIETSAPPTAQFSVTPGSVGVHLRW